MTLVALIITHLYAVSSKQQSAWFAEMWRTNLSFIVLLGTWLSCMKLKFETKGFVKDIEIDGGAVMNSLIVTYVWVQMGFPTGGSGVRSQMLT